LTFATKTISKIPVNTINLHYKTNH